MALPLQPSLTPWATWQRRLLAIGTCLIGITLLGLLGQPAARPPQLLLSAADSDRSYAREVERLINTSNQRVWVMVYVLYPGDEADHPVNALCAALAKARERGVDARVVIDIGREWGTEDISDKHQQGESLLRELGVPILLDEVDRTSHSKIVLIDDRIAVIGSHNWTRSALMSNRETSLLVDDPKIVRELEQQFTSVAGWAP